MRKLIAAVLGILVILAITVVRAQNGTTSYTVGEFQTANPNYPHPNPFYFEGKVDWNLLNITQPSNAWEYMEEGMHAQDDLGDIPDATTDYQTALSLNSLQNGSCQIVTAADLVSGALPAQLTPPPCIFTLRLRLGSLLQSSNPSEAISLFQEVLSIDPLRLGVNKLIGETYMIEAGQATSPTAQQQAYQNAIQALQAELALSPVTAQTIALTADQANNAHVHWDLAQIYQALGQNANAATEYQNYLLATQWHSDVYPWRINLAQQNVQILRARLRNRQ